ncbi:hypothetical protein MXB_814 [Myxobolus squamalis]|nr:hypothetical protein MXB_814 [Myxobolus squamalis]
MNFDSTGIKARSSTGGSKHSFVNENMDRSYDNLTYSYVGKGTPFVNDAISWTLYEIDRLSDQLDHPVVASDIASIGSTSSFVSSMLHDENQIRGKLFTRKLLKNAWVQKYYSFHKKSLTFNIFDASDFSGIPLHSYSVSQLSSCRLIKNQPSNVPKEFIHTGGFFELRIKKKAEIYIAPTISEATTWVDVLRCGSIFTCLQW